MKRDSKTIIPYENIDCELVELIKCINEIDGIETTECCCGHGTMPCQIWFKANSIEDVTHFIHNYLYCNRLWRIVINLTDNEIYDNEWNNPSYLLETTCSDYYYTGVSIDNLTYRIKEKQRELKEVPLSEAEKEDFDHEGFYNFLLNTIQPNEMEKYRSMFLSSGEIVN